MRKSSLYIPLGLMLAVGIPAANADLIVSEWSLLTLVRDTSTGQSEQVFSRFDTVTNPFNDKHSAAIRVATAWTQYDFAWLGDAGSFEVNATHHAEGIRGRVSSGGYAYFTPSVDTIVSIDGYYTYNLPVQPASVLMFLAVFQVDPEEALFVASKSVTNWLGPAAGTLTTTAEVILPAGQEYGFSYRFILDTFDPPIPGAVSNATGYVQFTLQPVPEPATLALLALASLWAGRRRRR